MLPPNYAESPFRTSYEMVRGHHQELLRQSEQARLLDEVKRQQPASASIDRRMAAWMSMQMLRLGKRLASYRKAAADPMRASGSLL